MADDVSIGCIVEGSGPPLVLVHGTSADATRWAPVVPGLARHFTVHAMHRRGRGTSGDGANDAGYSVATEAADIARVVDSLGERVSVVGHSYGGLASLEALLHTKKIASLVVYEPPVPTGTAVYPPGTLDDLETKLARGDREGVVTAFFQRVLGMNDAELANAKAAAGWKGRIAAAHTLPREIRATDRYVWDGDRFASVRAVPVGLLVGGASHPIARAMSELVAKSFSLADVIELADQKHVAMDTAPELFVREVLRVFEKLGQHTAA